MRGAFALWMFGGLLLCSNVAHAQQAGREPPEARVLSSRGEVQVSLPEQHAVRDDEVLTRGARVRTAETGSVRIGIANGPRLQVGEHSTLFVYAPATPVPPNVPAPTDMTLFRGRIHATGPDAENAPWFPLATPGGTVFLGRGEVIVYVDAMRATRVMVLRGRARIRATNREVMVRQGTGLSFEQGRPPFPARQLPTPPAWTANPPARSITGGAPIELRGTFGVPVAAPAAPGRPRPAGPPPPRLTHYHLQVASEERFDRIAVDRIVGAQETNFAERLGPGTWFARVAATDSDHYESVWSAPARMVVAAPRVVPGTNGRRATVEVPAGFFCGLNGMPMNSGAPMALAPAREHILRCSTNADGSNGVDVRINPLQAGPLVHSVRMEPTHFDASGGMRVIILHLTDAAGIPIPYADVRVTASAGIEVERVVEAEQRGLYTMTVRWTRGVTGMRLRFLVNNSESFEFTAGSPPSS